MKPVLVAVVQELEFATIEVSVDKRAGLSRI
jgi:hypothetical protein